MRTAGLQSQSPVAEIAQVAGVSVRMIYLAKRLMSMNRPDVVRQVEAGQITLNKAMEMAEGRKPRTSWDRLLRAWNSASDDDRARLLLSIKAPEPTRKPPKSRRKA